MARARPFAPVKYFCGILAAAGADPEAAEERLEARLGPVDARCGPIPFTHTDYYRLEMGADLSRHFVAFETLRDPAELASLKLFTNDLEAELAGASGSRALNIDPGYLNDARLVLASAKDFAHRLPLGGGVYAQLEYLFRRGGVRFLDWTFPEYRSEEVTRFFLALRERYHRQLKALDE